MANYFEIPIQNIYMSRALYSKQPIKLGNLVGIDNEGYIVPYSNTYYDYIYDTFYDLIGIATSDFKKDGDLYKGYISVHIIGKEQ